MPTPATMEDSAIERRLRPLDGKPPGMLLVHEIYRSIQGEGTRAGLPCVFVRLSACHLRCVYCDTPRAFTQGRVMSIDDVRADALAFGDPLVEITGGEPLLQPEVLPLMERLADAGRTVLLETGGGCDLEGIDPRVHVILDIKTPASGACEANHWPNLARLRPADEVKFVVCDRADFEWAVEVVHQHDLLERVPVLLAPAFGNVEPAALADWILQSRLPLRLQLQLHKYIWNPHRTGV